MLKNSPTHYGIVAKALHWLMAMLFIGMFVIAYIMTNIKSMIRFTLYDIHKATGLLLFTLVVFRLIWRFYNPQPKLPHHLPTWHQYLAKTTLIILYALMFVMPITGFLTSSLGGHEITFYHLFTLQPLAHDKNLSKFFEDLHGIYSYFFISAFILHIIGALYHHFFLEDKVFKRMLPQAN